MITSVDCEWGEFGAWSYCDKDCGGGRQHHSRKVYQEAQFGGSPCAGNAVEEQACNIIMQTCKKR